MPPSFRSAGTWDFTANNVPASPTLAPGAPSGVVAGDCLILVSASRSNSGTASDPTGWNLVSGFPKASGTASGGKIYVWTRIADGSADDTPSVSWSGLTNGTSGDSTGAGILCYQNLSETLDGTVQSSDLAAQTNTSVIPAFTTGQANSMVLGIAMKIGETSGQTSTVATFTERTDNSTTSGTGHIVAVSDHLNASAGSSGTATVTWSRTTSSRALTASLGLRIATNPVTATPAAGTATLSGLVPAVVLGTIAKPAAAALSATGFAPSVIIGVVAKAALGLAALTGLVPATAVSNNQRVAPAVGQAIATGVAPGVVATANQFARADVGVAQLDGLAPSVVIGVRIQPDTGAASLAGVSPSAHVTANMRASPATGTAALGGLAPTIVVAIVARPAVGLATLTGFASSVRISDNRRVQPSAGDGALSGLAPLLVFSIRAGVGPLALAGFAPNVTTNAGAVVPGTGVLTASGLAPAAAVTEHQRATPGTGGGTLTGLAPVVRAPRVVQAETGQLVATGHAPAVSLAGPQVVRPGIGVLQAQGHVPTVVVRPAAEMPSSLAAVSRSGEAIRAASSSRTVATATDVLIALSRSGAAVLAVSQSHAGP